MNTLTVGEFKAKFSDVIHKVLQGEEVAVTYGRKRKTIGVMIPFNDYKTKGKRKLGIWEGKGSVKFAKDFKMTVEEFLNS